MNEIADRLARMPADLRTCLAFFSRLPIRDPAHGFDLRAAAGAWPLAGALLALGAALVLWAARLIHMPPSLAALFAIAALIVVTGAMHEDGLADTADGLGGGTREQRLAIMRDSRIGTYGVVVLVVTILVRVGGLAALAFDAVIGGIALVTTAALSRSLALWHWHDTPPARINGLAHAAGQPDRAALLAGVVTGAIAWTVMVAVFGFASLVALILALGATFFLNRAVRTILGGHTGDTVGAAQQISEALLLAGLSTAMTATL